MSGAGRDNAGLRAGTSGSASMGDRGTGDAQVHSGLHSGGGDQYSGLAFAGQEQGGRLSSAAGAVRDKAGDLGDSARAAAGSVSGAASTAKARVSGVGDKARQVLEQRGFVDRIRENPLPVLGVAFALGFILAGNDDGDDVNVTPAGRARRELRGALTAGLSAGIAQGARGFLNQAGTQGGGFVNDLLEGLLSRVGNQASSLFGGGSTSGGSSAGSSRGGSYGGSAQGGRTGGATTTGRTGGSAGYGRTGAGTSRPPSHQENL